jgi:hypothetical protein
MYAEGLGIGKNTAEAIRLYEKAAIAGEFSAQIELGRIYARGADVPTDPGKALRWYSAAAQHEDIDDCEEMQEAKTYVTKFS